MDFYYDGYCADRFIKEGIAMSLGEKIDHLKSKHHDLETAIEEEAHRPHPDDIEITSLKKQKLKIKDEIASLDVN